MSLTYAALLTAIGDFVTANTAVTAIVTIALVLFGVTRTIQVFTRRR